MTIANHCVTRRYEPGCPGYPNADGEARDYHESAGRLVVSEGIALLCRDDPPGFTGRLFGDPRDEVPRVCLHICKHCGCVYAVEEESP